MNPITGTAMYIILWWLMLFIVLPFYSRPVAAPDAVSGWRGAPHRPRIWRIVITTTLVAAVMWLACYAVISSDWISFRSGYWSMPSD